MKHIDYSNFHMFLQVLMEIPCVLVTPKRKLAGRLAIMKKSLHFFGEFLVEGTGGSSSIKTYYSSGKFGHCKPENYGAPQRQKFLKNIDSVNGEKYQKQHKSIKRHRWWNINNVLKLFSFLF